MEEMPSRDELRRLAFKWKTGTLTKEEEQRLADWDEQQRDELLSLPDDSGGPEMVKSRMLANLLDAVHRDQADKAFRVRRLWPRIAAAASIVVAVGFGGYFLLHKKQTAQQITQTKPINIKPGGNNAFLTL
jgi:transmembrane sensor